MCLCACCSNIQSFPILIIIVIEYFHIFLIIVDFFIVRCMHGGDSFPFPRTLIKGYYGDMDRMIG